MYIITQCAYIMHICTYIYAMIYNIYVYSIHINDSWDCIDLAVGPNRLPSSCDTTRQCRHSASSPSSYLPRIHEFGLSVQENEQSCHCRQNLKRTTMKKNNLAFSHIDAHSNTHSIHLSDHNPEDQQTWLLSGHRVNKVNGLCPMCPTSMCQPQNKLAHHLCQSHRWCPSQQPRKVTRSPLPHCPSAPFWTYHTSTAKRVVNIQCNEMNVNELYIDLKRWLEIWFQNLPWQVTRSPINLREDMQIAITVDNPQQWLRLHLSKPALAQKPIWPESFLNGNTRMCLLLGSNCASSSFLPESSRFQDFHFLSIIIS